MSEDVKTIAAELLAARKILGKMPRGCNCSSSGAAKNKARKEYEVNVIRPLEDRLREANRNKNK